MVVLSHLQINTPGWLGRYHLNSCNYNFLQTIIPDFRLDMGCGGSLISNKHILTAYHCVSSIIDSGNNWGGRWAKISVHDQYDSDDYLKVSIATARFPDVAAVGQHDIAIIVLENLVTFDKTIQPVCLPNTGQEQLVIAYFIYLYLFISIRYTPKRDHSCFQYKLFFRGILYKVLLVYCD